MKLREIFRFELAYQVRRVSTWLYFAALLLFGFVAIRAIYIQDARSAGMLLNAPFVVASATVFGGVIWLLLAGAVAGEAAARDVETRMDPLTYSAPISKADYLGGRFLAAFALNALILLGVPLGILLALLTPGLEPELLGPFRAAAYLNAYCFIALPNAFVATAIQFSWATRTGRAISSYVAGVLILITSHVALTALASVLGLWQLTKLLDVVGLIGIISGHLDTWTPIEKNTRLLSLQGALLANRVLWLGVALGTLAITYRRFRFGHRLARRSWMAVFTRGTARPALALARTPAVASVAERTAISVPHVRRTFGLATYARQTRAIAWDSFRTIVKSRGGLTLVAAVTVPTVLFGGLAFMHFMGVPLLPRTAQVIRFFTPRLTELQTPWVIIPFLTLFYAGELVWRERDAGLSEMADAAPVPEWVLFLGKFLGLGLVLVVWLAFLMAAGILIQADIGNRTVGAVPDLEIGLYLQSLFGLQLANYLLFALLVLVIHVVADQKYPGHLVALIAYGFMAFASRLGIEHKLLVYASDPGWTYTDMRGFEPFLGPWIWFKLYWAAWALLLAGAARLLWPRGRERSLASRIHLSRRRFTRPAARFAAAAAGLVVTIGGFIFYSTNVLNGYRSTSSAIERRAEYERRYGQYKDIPQPRLMAINLRVELYPRRRKADIHGTYRLVNSSAAPIDAIHLATASGVETGNVTFNRLAATVLADEDLGHRIYALKTPLQAGDALTLDFDVRFEPRGFGNSGIDASLVANGTTFTRAWLPAIGYQGNRELGDARSRRTHGLAPRPEFASVDDDEASGMMQTGVAPTTVETIVGTDEDQIAVAVGTLRRTWTAHGRRYFHYVTDAPIKTGFKVFSAAYAVREGHWNDVAIRIFHHPGHARQVDRMMRAVQASLDYNSRQFGPYPHRAIKVVEHPGHGLGMHADAGTIDHEEGFSLINPRDPSQGLDLVFYVVAHEVGHQWWGHQLAPARAEGIGLVGETLASYAGMRVVDQTYGREHTRRLLDMWRASYDVPRTRAAVPLLRATNQAFLYRRKAPLAMHALSEYIGAAQVDTALRRLFEKHGSETAPLTTSMDLYRELQAVTPAQFQSLLHDLFEVNAYWELKTEQATAQQTAAGTWQVTLDVYARKVVVDEAGVETEMPMDEWIPVGVFGEGEPYMEKHRVRSGKQTITVTLPRKPSRAGIDPDYLLFDLETSDNIKAVRVKS